MAIIPKSFLDTDLYKITMGQAIFDAFSRISVEYELINRARTVFPRGFAEELQCSVEAMVSLALSAQEKEFLQRRCGHYLKPTYLDWLSNYRFNPEEVSINQEGDDLRVLISGPWYRTVFWEVPLMATISELYFRMTGQVPKEGWVQKAEQKGRVFREAKAQVVDFGTRRRFSLEVQDQVIQTLIGTAGRTSEGGVLRGTSNLFLAMKYNLAPVGTFAHEWVMVHAALFGYRMATLMALQSWAKEFDGQLGIALSDTFGTNEFLRNFTAFYANLFSGVRQDSGDPVEVMEKVIKHYQGLFIDPTTKTFVASDSLDVEKVLRILGHCQDRIRCLFGIGTNLTNDVGVTPLNFVIKLFRVLLDGIAIPVVKLSDDKGKISGDPRAIRSAQAAFSEIGF